MSGVPAQKGRAFLEHPRLEVVPVRGVEAELDHIPERATVTVTSSPKKGIDATLDLCEYLRERGFTPVPHIAARLVVDREHVEHIARRLSALEITDVFVIGGDVPKPAGRFESSAALITDLMGVGYDGVVGVAGYPESHPFISTERLWNALRDKQPHAAYIVSQICFDSARILAWARELRRREITLPVWVGFPGVVDRKKLMRVALRIGVGDSTRYLTKHANLITRLVRPGGYNPDELVRDIAPHADDTSLGLGGYHINTFNQVASTERWRRRSLEAAGASSSSAARS
jgi:methylenetetrahydrofolate reductase (NADPH)